MDREMIRRWNKQVREKDIVYHLGDFGAKETAATIIKQLNGAHIYILPGNYDDEEVIDQLTTDPRVTILDSGHPITIEGVNMML